MKPSELTGYEEGLKFTGCEWSTDDQDACTRCAGAYCCLCVRTADDEPCNHDSFARHFSIPVGYREPQPVG